MEKPNDIIIRFTIYGFLIGIFFPVASLLIHRLTDDVSFSFQGFSQLHKLFPGQILLDLIPILSTLAGVIAGYSESSHQIKLRQKTVEDQKRSNKILAFTEKLISNELDASLDMKDPGDPLGKSLINLRDNLKQNIEEQQQRKKEDDQRNWGSEGLAKFGDILRGSFENMEDFAYNIISYLVKYMNANQGGFFLVEQESGQEKYFDLKASYAYDRRKFSDKKIEWGEGIIGTCALEKQTIYMMDLPEGYLEITSGLGQSTPDHLLIVPLIVQEEVLGIIELASFHTIQDFEIGFVESIAESTAITLSSLRSNIRTASLLKESQNQAEALALQDEKMRQSMDQLKQTQEQAAQQAEKFISFTNSVNHTLIRAEYDTEGILKYANTKFLHMLGYFSNAEVEGQHISIFLDEKDMEWFDPIWKRLSEGGKHYEGYMKHLTKTGQDLWTMATYTCVRKDGGSVDKILFLAIDTTEQRKQSLDYEGQIDSINRLNIKIEFAPDGKFINCNELFLNTMKFSRKELEKMSVFDFIEKPELESFNETWEGVTKGVPYQGQLKSLTKYDDEKWFRVSYTAVNDMYGEVSKVICLANDISNERMMELESRKYTEQLKVQEDKLKLASVELKKKLEQSKTELGQQYQQIIRERDRMQNVLLNDPEIILTIDQSTRILFMNLSAEKFFGVKSATTLGKDLKSLFPGDMSDMDSFILSLADPKARKITWEKKKVRIHDKTGKMFPAEIHLSIAEQQDEVSYTAFISLL
ncbi:PAS domain S-box protein [Bacteroidota bacterium]